MAFHPAAGMLLATRATSDDSLILIKIKYGLNYLQDIQANKILHTPHCALT